MASSPSFDFQSNFDASLQSYNDKTKNNLLDHPLANQLQSYDTPNAVLSVLQDLIQQFGRRRKSDERLLCFSRELRRAMGCSNSAPTPVPASGTHGGGRHSAVSRAYIVSKSAGRR